jgi:hypothetical protein
VKILLSVTNESYVCYVLLPAQIEERTTKQTRGNDTETTTLPKKKGENQPHKQHHNIQIKSKLYNVFFFSKTYVMYFLFTTHNFFYVHIYFMPVSKVFGLYALFLHQNLPFPFKIKGHQNALMFYFIKRTYILSF